MTGKELGKKLFEIHHHAVIDGDGESCIMYKEEDIINLLKELGHPAPDWDWYKDDPSFKKTEDEA